MPYAYHFVNEYSEKDIKWNIQKMKNKEQASLIFSWYQKSI